MSSNRGFPDHVQKVSSICENLDFCILSTSPNMLSIGEVRELILKHGGRVVEYPGPSTFALIAGELTMNVQKFADQKRYNIVKLEWVIRTLGSSESPQELPKFQPKDMISCNKDLEDYFTKSFDEYGDSFTTPVDCASLKNLLDNMELDMCDRLLRRELIDVEVEIYGSIDKIRNFFRPFDIYFFNANQCHETKFAEIIFKSRHGNVVDDFVPSNSSIIAINPRKEFLDQFRERLPLSLQEEFQLQLVAIEWIIKSNSEGKLLDICSYLIPNM